MNREEADREGASEAMKMKTGGAGLERPRPRWVALPPASKVRGSRPPSAG